MTTRILGVRHHGPGSARAVVAALEALRPDTVLIEGPADADAVIPFARSVDLRPPVALLAYAVDNPGEAAFWPLAVFSPEWQALQWGLQNGATVRFCDLPAAQVLAVRQRSTAPEPVDPEDETEAPPPGRQDPIAQLAAAAGYDDPERWWDDVMELRLGDVDPFDAVTEAMTDLRAHRPSDDGRDRDQEARREAYMRSVLRTVVKEGAERVAVVCGAWHSPALTAPLPSATADAAVLRGAVKRKVALTWVPWTHSRLAFASGYGAGIDSPGWYHHLFTTVDLPVTRWLTKVAGVLREADLPVSSAHVIEAVRLSETLAAIRGRPLAGLAELTDATRAVLCDGDEGALALVVRSLVVGEALGAVPEDTPTVPLDADLRAQARRLKLKQEAGDRRLDLDLRSDFDRDRSRLLHRLALLGIGWGTPARSDVRNLGTFRESWALRWQPEFAVAVVLAAMWGATVGAAAAAKLADAASGATLPAVTAAVENCLLADLPDALTKLLDAVDARAAADGDIGELMSALAPLARSLRYGDVRGTDRTGLARVTDTLLVRVRAGLPAAMTGLDDTGAAALRAGIDEVHQATGLLDDDARGAWLDTLAGLAGRDDVHGALTCRMSRLLHDAGRLDGTAIADRLARALSVGATPAAKAAWVDGFFTGGGLLLMHDPDLLALLDDWVVGLDGRDFVDILPLLRRTFGGYATGERRAIGELVKRGTGVQAPRPASSDIDPERGLPVARTIAAILGVPI